MNSDDFVISNARNRLTLDVNNRVDFTRQFSDLANSILNQNLINNTSKQGTQTLTAETLRILSKININDLSLNSKFDLLFNDLGMLKASAVQGYLSETNFRFLAWMIFLECIPMEKNRWIAALNHNREVYRIIREDFTCDPHKSSNKSLIQDGSIDHPLSKDENSIWYRYFSQNEVKAVIIQDVNRMLV